ncbi:MAG: group II intron reverse transcriptase [Xenococcaceae cyanobacterium]
MTRRKRFQDEPLLKISALNAVLRGWINYYRHCNVKKIAKDLDFWVNQRLFLWLQKRHKLSPRRIVEKYKLRENGKRYNFGTRNGDKYQFLYRMSDLSLSKYRSRSPENPYLAGEWITTVSKPEFPMLQQTWNGNADNTQWRSLKEEIKAERGSKCELCASKENLDLHHIIRRKKKGNDLKENLQLLCRSCHAQTPSFGRPRQQ